MRRIPDDNDYCSRDRKQKIVIKDDEESSKSVRVKTESVIFEESEETSEDEMPVGNRKDVARPKHRNINENKENDNPNTNSGSASQITKV
jgi:hypothetical protein